MERPYPIAENTKEEIERKIKEYLTKHLPERYFRVRNETFYARWRTLKGLSAESFTDGIIIDVFQADSVFQAEPFSWIIRYRASGSWKYGKHSADSMAKYAFAKELGKEDFDIIECLMEILTED